MAVKINVLILLKMKKIKKLWLSNNFKQKNDMLSSEIYAERKMTQQNHVNNFSSQCYLYSFF